MTFFIFKLSLPLIVFYRLTFASPVPDDVKVNTDRDATDQQTLWFGPRLGKRSNRNPYQDNRDVYEALLDAADALKTYYEQLQSDGLDTRDTKKVFTPILGRRGLMHQYADPRALRAVDLTPRLGRRLEDTPATPADQELYEYQAEPGQMERRTKFFSPRLGRRTASFSPRLGRELVYDIYPEKIRLARSTNETKSS